ncbi:S27A2 synthetase, partial [Atlantisia rogersi]|nr:S27A2 synthetase [Atlantisia rogersi]
RRLRRRPTITLLDVFQGHARNQPHRVLLRYREEVYTYQDVERRSNRLGRALLGLLSPQEQRGGSVAVFLPNEPAYIWTWLALAKLGIPMACLNSNVRGQALRHALAAAGATVIIASTGE